MYLRAVLIFVLPAIPVLATAVLRGTTEQTKALVLPTAATSSLNITVDGCEEEDRDDAQAWKSGQPFAQSFGSRIGSLHGVDSVLPPKCPADVSVTSPYMLEHVLPNVHHTMCDYRQPCDRRGPNLERLNSIRGLLKQTKKLLNGLGVPYALYGGSAIGQERCRDVLPWDSDCDVIVWEQDVHKISSGDIDSQYTVRWTQGNSAVPYVVADTYTGFYCDIFFMKYDPSWQKVGMAWPWGESTCFDMETSYPFNEEVKKCDKFDANLVHPFSPCVFDGVEHTCFHNQAGFLEEKWGKRVLDTPNITTQPGGGVRSLM